MQTAVHRTAERKKSLGFGKKEWNMAGGPRMAPGGGHPGGRRRDFAPRGNMSEGNRRRNASLANGMGKDPAGDIRRPAGGNG
jgi:hypothetical protein